MMDAHYPPIQADATPDQVLAILRDAHRQQSRVDPEADPTATLGRETTVAQWRDACDLVKWEPLAKALNIWWEMNVPPEEWRAVLEPAKARTLGGVCDLIARYAKVPQVRPARFFGQECVTAGVFLTVRSYLAAAGADVRELAPSTPLDEYTRRYAGIFLARVSQLAPGALPPVTVRNPLYHACVLAFAASWLGMIVGVCAGLCAVWIPSLTTAGVAYWAIWYVARNTLPSSVTFGGLTTFRDLATVIAASTAGRDN